MGSNIIPSFLERRGNLIRKVTSTYAGNLAALEHSRARHEEAENAKEEAVKELTWADMLANYPAEGVTTEDLYETIGGGLPENYQKNPYSWENSCAIRMSKALNYSGIKLPKAPSRGGNINGKDGFNYWIRVKDLQPELIRQLKSIKPLDKKAAPGIVSEFENKKGIIVFDVAGWANATGHFTLWDGKDLLYVGAGTPEHNDPNDAEMYYFHMSYQDTDEDGNLLFDKKGNPVMIKTTRIRLWELL
jgi:hypothetical protein